MRGIGLVIAILSAGAGHQSLLAAALGAGPSEVGRLELEPERSPAAILPRSIPASQQNLRTAALPAVEGQAVFEPLSRRSAALQLRCRAQLKARLNRILPTQDTPRGLVVSVSASLLSNRHALTRETSEKLARIAEIIPPDVAVRVEAYTDDRRTSARKESASSGLAETVRDVLVENDSVPREIMAKSFVSNAMARASANRCVQIVIAGQGIGQSVLLARTSRSAMHSGGLVRGRHMIAMNAEVGASGSR